MSFLPLTLVTTCKPFRGETGIMQKNALHSWKKLPLDILIFGDEDGVANICSNTGATQVVDIERSSQGVPLLGSLFEKARALSDTTYLAYANADIILRDDLVEAMHMLNALAPESPPALITAKRRNIPASRILDFETDELDRLLQKFGCWDQANAADLFIFHRDLFQQVPPFAIGRNYWDNWLLWQARQENARVIDATGTISVIHPIHGYSSHTSGWHQVNQGADAQQNHQICQGRQLNIEQARTDLLIDGELLTISAVDNNSYSRRFTFNRQKSVLGSLHSLMTGLATRDISETLDRLRNLLTTNQIYFPLDNRDPTPAYSLIETRVKEANILAETGKLEDALQLLQSIFVESVIEQARQIHTLKRPLLIWGAGSMGQRLQALFDRLHIPFTGFLDSNQAKIPQPVNGKPVISSGWKEAQDQLGSRPFIFIASMYWRDIAAQLQSAGLQYGEDFLA